MSSRRRLGAPAAPPDETLTPRPAAPRWLGWCLFAVVAAAVTTGAAASTSGDGAGLELVRQARPVSAVPASTPTPSSEPTGLPVSDQGTKFAGTPESQTYYFKPTTVRLPSGSSAEIEPVGIDSAAVLAVPDDPAEVGWWTGGALAGEPFGSVVIAGHVDSSTSGLGALAELRAASVGAEVVLGDGTGELRYRIVSVENVPKARLAPDFEPFDQRVDHRLVLITCGGAYDRSAHSYADNVVVVAEPIS